MRRICAAFTNGKHAGDDRHLDAALVAQVVLELQKVIHVVEELGDDELGPGLDLGGAAVPVELLVRHCTCPSG